MTKSEINKTINEAKSGNQSAFRTILNHFWGYVYNYLISKKINDEDAEDITIQTFSKAFEKINLFDDKYEFKTWLISISKNIHKDNLRKKEITTANLAEHHTNSFIDKNPSPEEQLILKQNLAELLKDIKQLKPKYQQIINLRFFQELSYKEISEQIGEPMNNVKVKLLRAKKLLAEIIKKNNF